MKNHSKTEEQTHMSFELPEFTLSQSTSQVIYKRCQTALVVLAIGIIANLALRIDFVLLNGNVGEISVTEMLQQLLLIVSSGSFAYLARKRSEVKHAAALISAFFAVLFIREMDFWFDKIAHGAWVVPAALVAGSAIFYAVKKRQAHYRSTCPYFGFSAHEPVSDRRNVTVSILPPIRYG
ncbi:membrane hypothetical protein [Vibrio chagasii]|nr:membrane hypothetical protein [Vibrio chagasii]